MMPKCAPWHALIKLPAQLVSVRDKDTEVNSLPNPEKERGKQPVAKAEHKGRRVSCGSATPA